MTQDEFAKWGVGRNIEVVRVAGAVQVKVAGRAYMTWVPGDEVSERMAIVQLYGCGLGKQEELAEVFGVHVSSVQRHIANFWENGGRGLVPQRSGPRSAWKMRPDVRAKILMIVFHDELLQVEEIRDQLAKRWRVHVSAVSIRQVLLENGLLGSNSTDAGGGLCQRQLFDTDAPGQLYLDFDCPQEPGRIESEQGETADDPSEPPAERIEKLVRGVEVKAKRYYSPAQRTYLAGLEQGDYNAYAGGLLFAPLLDRNGFLPALKRVVRIPGYEGYSLEDLSVTLLYWDLFGFRSMEDFKRAYPEEFGLLIGRASSPSLFTLRRFLHKVRELNVGEAVMEEFAVEYLRTGVAQWGVLYIDGHFLPYYGSCPITKGWHAVRRLPMKGSYNFLAVDENFNPWLFLIRNSSEDLLQKIPELIAKARAVGQRAGVESEEPEDLIVVFDREGYSAELFRILDGREDGQRKAIFLTWAKYANKWVKEIAAEKFDHTVRVPYDIQETKEVRYFQTQRTMNKYGKIRTIVIEDDWDGGRAAIYTNGTEEEISAERAVQLICRRWGEENAIKELMLKHLINYHPGYVKEGLEEQPLVDNPKVTELKKEKARCSSQLHKVKVQLADAVLRKGQQDANWEEIKQRELETLEQIVCVESQIGLLSNEISELPNRVRFDEAHGGTHLKQLNYEKKRFLDCIKLFAYNTTRQMCRLLLQHYDREKEILPALSMIVGRGGEAHMKDGRLHVVLRRFRNGEIDYAARHLCEDLNSMKPKTLDRFHLPLHYDVQ